MFYLRVLIVWRHQSWSWMSPNIWTMHCWACNTVSNVDRSEGVQNMIELGTSTSGLFALVQPWSTRSIRLPCKNTCTSQETDFLQRFCSRVSYPWMKTQPELESLYASLSNSSRTPKVQFRFWYTTWIPKVNNSAAALVLIAEKENQSPSVFLYTTREK